MLTVIITTRYWLNFQEVGIWYYHGNVITDATRYNVVFIFVLRSFLSRLGLLYNYYVTHNNCHKLIIKVVMLYLNYILFCQLVLYCIDSHIFYFFENLVRYYQSTYLFLKALMLLLSVTSAVLLSEFTFWGFYKKVHIKILWPFLFTN